MQVFARIKLFFRIVFSNFSVFAFALVVVFFFHLCAMNMDAIRAVPFFVRRNNHLIFFPPFTSNRFIQSVSRVPNEMFHFFSVITFFIDLDSSNFIFRIYSINANISHTLIRMCGKIYISIWTIEKFSMNEIRVRVCDIQIGIVYYGLTIIHSSILITVE